MLKLFIRIGFMITLLGIISCIPIKKETRQLSFTAEAAPEWDALFKRNEGWFGGDGIFAIPVNASNKKDSVKQLIIFSDTMLGLIKDGKLQKDYHMVNNSVAFLKGKEPYQENISFPVPKDTFGQDRSIFPVQLPSKEASEYYWLGDGFFNHTNGQTYIFAYRVVDRPEWEEAVFKFEFVGAAIIILPPESTFPFEDQRQMAFPFYKFVDMDYTTFGAGIFENTEAAGANRPDGYIYVYGVRDPGKELLVARIEPHRFEQLDAWTFWDGNLWSDDFNQAVAISDSVSNELSLTELPNGQFALIFQISGIVPDVGMRLGDSPVGPFGPIQKIWDCSDALEASEFFAYNAKAHPTLSNPGELLVSYNVNSFAFWDQIESYPNLYRPRFFKLIFN
jgi:hypothetical protein